MEYTQKSVKIPNDITFAFRLICDPIKGFIRLSKYKSTTNFTRITDRNVPITVQTKYKFTNERTDWSDLNHNYKGFIGSYISKELDPEGYKRWESYIRSNYKALRSIYNEF